MRRLVLGVLSVAILASGTVRAATVVDIPLGATRADIQAAINAAPAGATIAFAPGLHALGAGPEILISKPLRLRSGDGGRALMLGSIASDGRPDPSTANRCFRFVAAGTVDVRGLDFEGFRQGVQVEGRLNTD